MMAFDPDAYLGTSPGAPQAAPSVPAPAGGGFNPDKYLDESSNVKQDSLKQSMYVASTRNPDEHAKVIDLSKKTGVPTDLIDKDTMSSVKEASVQNGTDFNSLTKEAPKYSDWLTNPDNASVSHDDIGTGTAIEKSVNAHSANMNFFEGVWSRIKQDFNAGVESSVSGMIARRALPETQLPEDSNALDRLISGVAAYGSDIPWFLAGGAAGAVGGATVGATTMGLAGSVVPVAGTLAGIGVGAVGGGAVGSAYGAFALQSALHTAVSEYLKDGAPEDLPEFIARTKHTLIEANKQGLLGVALAGVGKVAQVGGEAVFGAATKTARAATKAVSLGAEIGTFGKGQAVIEGRDAKPMDYVDAAAFIMTMHGVGAVKEKAAQSYMERAKAQSVKDFIQGLGNQTEQSKLHERAPEVYGEMVDHLTTDRANPDLPIQSEPSAQFVYFQSDVIDKHFSGKNISPEQAMNEIGAIESYNEAKKTGADIKIPMSEFVTKVSKSEHFDALLNDVKTDPSAMSVNEANEAIKQSHADMKAADEEAKAQADAPVGVDVAGPMKEQLLSTGRFTDKEAQLAADHHARFIEGVSRVSSIPVEDVLKRFPLEIKDGSELINNTDATAMVLEQSRISGVDGNVIMADFGGYSGNEPMSLSQAETEKQQRIAKQTKYLGKKAESLSDHGREMLSSWNARHSGDKELLKATKAAQDGAAGPYVGSKEVSNIGWVPNYAAEPTGVIGEPRVQQPNDVKKFTNPDPFMWADDKYKAGRELLQKHKDAGMSVVINTSSDLIARKEYIEAMPKDTTVNLYVGTRDSSLNRILFPGNASLARQEAAAKTLKEAGIKVNIIRPDAESIVKEVNRYDKGRKSDALTFGEQLSKEDLLKRAQQAAGLRVLNQDGVDEGPRGQIAIDGKNFRIDFFKTADLSTAIHELSHFHFEVLGRLAGDEKSNQTVKDDYAKILNWLGAENKESVTDAQHEQFARGIEAYLMEGKAPTAELRPAFARFKAWLLHIYKDIRNLKVELNPEIRNVFDRLMAADDQIKATQAEQHQEPLFSPEGKIKMSADRAEAYHKAVEEARAVAQDRVTQKLLNDYRRARSEVYHDKRTEVKASVEAEVSQRNVYKAIDTLQHGELADGTKIKLSKADVIASWGAKAFEVLKSKSGKYLYARDGGVHPDIAAHLFGYESGDAMMQDILNAPDKNSEIERMTDDRMAGLFPDSYLDGSLPQEAIDAVHNDKRAHILRMELEELAQNHLPVLKDIIRRVARRVPTDADVRNRATQIVGAKTVAEVQPHIYALAERKNAKLAGEALAKGDVDLAFDYKHKELLSHELYRTALDAREYIDKQMKAFKKLARPDEKISKVRDTDLVNAARSVLAMFGIGKKGKTAESYLASLKEYDPDRYNSMMNHVNSAIEGAGDYKGVSLDAFVKMSDAVNALYDLSKSIKEIQIDGRKMEMQQANDELQSRISEVVGDPKVRPGVEKAVTTLEKHGLSLLTWAAKVTRMEHWIGAFDGELKGEALNGPGRKYIWQPVKEATTKYRLERVARMKELKTIFQDLNGRLSQEKVHSPELGYSPKKGEMLMMILHRGNESNYEKMLMGRADKNGRAWGEMKEDGTLDDSRFKAWENRMIAENHLTKADYDFAQKVWNLFEEMKVGAQNAHKEMYGYHFNEITAKTFQTPFGEYKGGYVPAKIDHFLNEDHAIRQEREARERNNNSWQFPTTGRGFTKSRVESYHAPLSLDLNMLASHIDSVLRFTHIEPRVKEVARLVSNKEFRNSLTDLNSKAGKDLIVPWLQSAATQRTSIPGDPMLDKILRSARTNVGVQTLVLNVANTFHNLTSGILAGTKVNAASLIKGLGQYAFDHKATSEMVTEKSDYMRMLKETHVNDSAESIKKIIADPNGYQNFTAWVREHGFFMQRAAQDIVTTSVWTGAYDQAIARGAEEHAAIKEADSIVSQTQHVGGAEDMAAYEKGTELAKMFSHMTGFFNKVLNVNVGSATAITRELGLKKSAIAPMGQLYFYGFLMMAVSAQAIIDGLYGWKPEADDDGETGTTMQYLSHLIGGSQKSLAISMVPFAGPLINSTISHFGQGHGDDIRYSPIGGAVASAVRAPGEVMKVLHGEVDLDKKTTKDVLALLGLMTGLPFGVLGRPIGYQMDVNAGKVFPTSKLDHARGLITGARGNQ